jgi:hypothetical protein
MSSKATKKIKERKINKTKHLLCEDINKTMQSSVKLIKKKEKMQLYVEDEDLTVVPSDIK